MPNYKTVEGIRLVSSGSHWESEDGRFGVQLETGVTFCDTEHVMRITRHMFDEAQQRPTYADNPAVLAAWNAGKRGYICPGMCEHGYPIWTVWVDGETADDMGDTYSEAIHILGREIRALREEGKLDG